MIKLTLNEIINKVNKGAQQYRVLRYMWEKHTQQPVEKNSWKNF